MDTNSKVKADFKSEANLSISRCGAMRLEGIRDPTIQMNQLKIGNSVLSRAGFKIMKNVSTEKTPTVKADSDEFIFTFVDAHARGFVSTLLVVAAIFGTF